MADSNTQTESKVPYISAYGNITKALEKIQQAATPPRFTQDFLATKLGLSGGSAKPLIPFLKRIGLLGPDGSPTTSYKKFRNATESGAVAADALRRGFNALFEVNEYAQDLSDKDLRGVIVQVTGFEEKSKTVGAIVGSFNALKAFADFDAPTSVETSATPIVEKPKERTQTTPSQALPNGISLGYTINLHLPATSDIAVFDAIFKSLNEHLMRSK